MSSDEVSDGTLSPVIASRKRSQTPSAESELTLEGDLSFGETTLIKHALNVSESDETDTTADLQAFLTDAFPESPPSQGRECSTGPRLCLEMFTTGRNNVVMLLNKEKTIDISFDEKVNDDTTKVRGLPIKPGTKRHINYGKLSRVKQTQVDDFSQELSTQLLETLKTQVAQLPTSIVKGDSDNDFDLSKYQKPSRKSFAGPRRGPGAILSNTAHLVERFDQARSKTLFTTGCGKDFGKILLPTSESPKSLVTTGNLPTRPQQNESFCGFTTGRGVHVKSDRSLVGAVNDEIKETNPTSAKTDKAPLDPVNEQNIGLKANGITALQEIDQNAYEEKMTQRAFPAVKEIPKPIIGFQTGLGVQVHIDEVALNAVKQDLPKKVFTGFQSGLGVQVKVDESAMMAVKQDIPKTSFGGFQTGLGTQVKISEESLLAVRNNSSNPPKFSGFSTGLGKKVDVCEESLKAVKSGRMNTSTDELILKTDSLLKKIPTESQSASAKFFNLTRKCLESPKLPVPEFMNPAKAQKRKAGDLNMSSTPKRVKCEETEERVDPKIAREAQLLMDFCTNPVHLTHYRPSSLDDDKEEIQIHSHDDDPFFSGVAQPRGFPRDLHLKRRRKRAYTSLFDPESESNMYKMAKIAEKVEIEGQSTARFAIPFKAAAPFSPPVLKSTPKTQSIHTDPGIELSPIREDKTLEDEFEMSMDDDADQRILNDDELKRLDQLIAQIEMEIQLTKKHTENRKGQLWQRKTYYRQKQESVSVRDLIFSPSNSRHLKSITLNLFDFFPRENIIKGERSPDGGTYSCAPDGSFTTRHIRRTLLSSTINSAFHAKASIPWVENHVKLIMDKLTGYTNYLSDELRGEPASPDFLMEQLRYRADLEFIDGKRSIIVKISEQDISPAAPMVLYTSSRTPLRLSDGWYEINCSGDTLVERRLAKLPLGSKVLICGASLPKDANAGHPLTQFSEINISANSTRRVKWHTKLGYFFKAIPPAKLSTIANTGKNIFRVEVKLTRRYPDIWIQDNPSVEKRRRIVSKRQMNRWHAQRERDVEKKRESLVDSIRKKHRDNLDEDLANMTFTEISHLDDASDIYGAVTLSKDPNDTISNLTDEQRRKYTVYAGKQNSKINDSFHRQSRENSAISTRKIRFKVCDGQRSCVLQVNDRGLAEDIRPGSTVILEGANIFNDGTLTLQKHGSMRPINFLPVKLEIPSKFETITPEVSLSTKEVDVVGVVVQLTPSTCILADNNRSYVNIECRNTWEHEALDKIVLVGEVLAIKSLQIDRYRHQVAHFTDFSEVLTTNSDFGGQRGPLFNLYNAMRKVSARSGYEKFVKDFRTHSSAPSTPVRSTTLPNISSTPVSSKKRLSVPDRIARLDMESEKWQNISDRQKPSKTKYI